MKICVFGSGKDEIAQIFKDEAFQLGKELAKQGYDLVYGGSKRGLMGASASGFKCGGGHITAIVPTELNDSRMNEINDEIIVTENIPKRLEKMFEKSDILLVLPGGIGTLNEYISFVDRKRLHEIEKPIVVFNINGYYEKLFHFMDDIIEAKFMSKQEKEMYQVGNTLKEVIQIISQHK